MMFVRNVSAEARVARCVQAAPRPPGGAAEGQPVQAVRSGAAQDGLVPGTQDICTKIFLKGDKYL